MSKFNDDLDDYLNKRNSTKTKSYTYTNNKFYDKVPDNLSEDKIYIDKNDKEKTSLFQNLLKKFGFTKKESKDIEEISEELNDIETKEDYIEHEAELLDQEYEELEEEKESLFQRLLSLFRRKSSVQIDEEELNEESTPQVYEDVDYNAKLRTLIKSLHPWLSRLKGSDLREFKHSPEYKEYVKLLDDLGMLK